MNKILLIAVLIGAYLLMINITVYMMPLLTFSSTEENTEESSGMGERIKVGQSLSINVKRPRAYGTIYEQDGNSQLQLLNVLPLPLKIGGFNFLWIYITFLILMLILAIRKTYKPKYPYYENETLD